MDTRDTIEVMILAANWKAYVESSTKAKALLAAAKKCSAKSSVQIILAPPAPYLGLLISGKTKVAFASQDVSATTGGATTGEITAAVLSEMGVSYAILGHSERRMMGDTDRIVVEKVQHALAHGLTPILCIGESVRDADAKYLSHLRTQLSAVFEALSPKERLAMVVAYEPIWAIGKSSAEAITPQDLGEMVLYIRKVLADYIPGRGGNKVPVLYGGSVEPTNARALAQMSGIDGFLVGHASVDVTSFTSLVKAIS